MKQAFYGVALAACILATWTAPHAALGQTGVVVIDVRHIFKHHTRFNQAMELLKKDVQAYEGVVRNEQKKLRDMTEQLKERKAGTPDYKRLEEDIAKFTSDLQVQSALKRKEFIEREAKLYYQTYNEIYARVAEFAERNGISLVLRFNSEPISAEDRQSVIEGVNRPIVYQRNLDITLAILDQCNRSAPEERISRPPIPAGPKRR